MKPTSINRPLKSVFLMVVLCCLSGTAHAATTVFFNSSQTTNLVASNTTSDTISSEGYLFTYTRDKLFTGGTSEIIGRAVRVPWPEGLEAQGVGGVGGAKMTIRRMDGELFSMPSLSFKLLASTAGAGATMEIMPLLNGEDGLADPVFFDATGYYGQQFSYNTASLPVHLGNTTALANFDEYKISLYVDFAITSLTIVDASIPPPLLAISPLGGSQVEISWPAIASGYALESSTNLASSVWSPVTNSAVINGNQYTVQTETTEPQRAYRLRK